MRTRIVKRFTLNDFDIGDDPIMGTLWHLERDVIPQLNLYGDLYNKDKNICWIIEIKKILPKSYKWGDIFE